jgi:hypothetical protein
VLAQIIAKIAAVKSRIPPEDSSLRKFLICLIIIHSLYWQKTSENKTATQTVKLTACTLISLSYNIFLS